MEVFEAIKNRRSIRKFKAEPIPPELLDEILDTARYAPSWANTQVWELIIVKERATKVALAGTLSKGNPSATAIKEAPVVLAACGKKGESGFYKGEQLTVLGDWLLFDVALFLATLNLAAHAKGLGMVHVGAFNIPQASAILEVPDTVQVVELLPLGYPDHLPKTPSRKEIKDFVHYDKY